jgi:hypothetical protein
LARLIDVSTYALAPLSKNSDWLIIVGRILVSDGSKIPVRQVPFEQSFQSAYITYYVGSVVVPPNRI